MIRSSVLGSESFLRSSKGFETSTKEERMFGEIRRWRRNDGVQRSVGHLMTCSVDTCLHTLYDLGV